MTNIEAAMERIQAPLFWQVNAVDRPYWMANMVK